MSDVVDCVAIFMLEKCKRKFIAERIPRESAVTGPKDGKRCFIDNLVEKKVHPTHGLHMRIAFEEDYGLVVVTSLASLLGGQGFIPLGDAVHNAAELCVGSIHPKFIGLDIVVLILVHFRCDASLNVVQLIEASIPPPVVVELLLQVLLDTIAQIGWVGIGICLTETKIQIDHEWVSIGGTLPRLRFRIEGMERIAGARPVGVPSIERLENLSGREGCKGPNQGDALGRRVLAGKGTSASSRRRAVISYRVLCRDLPT
mmetsp:Transcript_29539/g.86052  ORF Transcript_29539/g.86052 Transcript_29539/m.86052 type:complete len:258 (+) Transcript_29539:1753-2526(+)